MTAFAWTARFMRPPGMGIGPGPVDEVLLIHGSRGDFYDGATKSMARDLSAQGYACLPLKTNARDTAWYNPGGQNVKGNAFAVLAHTCTALGSLSRWACG